MDFFSNLPDELVCHILSFLTTTEAASTSVLSKRWSNLFALVPNIDFEDTVFWSYDCKKTPSSFIDFVDRVMALQGDSPIKKFSLKCQSGRVDSGRVNSWICNVLQRGVSDLDLSIDFERGYSLPPNMFHSDTLDHVFLRFRNVSKLMSGIRHVQKLYLSSDTLEVLSLRYESIPVFNNLKVLCIRSSAHGGWQAMPELLRSCPLLETLVLKGLLHYVTDKCGDACDCISREDKGRSLISCPVRKLQIERLQRTKRELEMIKHFLESFRCVKEVEIYAEENNLVDYLQVPREFELFNELYSCDVRFLARGSLHKTWTTVYCTTNQVVKEENFS
ncbi:putative F-box protein At3g58950 isoform X2 [Capsella rubella]|uniref:putative F-box protein At3g58950 isoform X2 n=1 Tax=Capsella rubella TaxID=81985 RepID=UPI000CD4EB4B|nr:putative F-box protein At3g58950 isoform X2 [Capsella rubella]